MEHHVNANAGEVTALDRVRLVSQALSDAARRSRISSRSRRAYVGGGFKARRGAVALRWAAIVSFYAMVVAPTLASVIYYGLIASDQYVATADFVVGGGEPIPIDGLGSLTGIPMAAIVQDTQIVANYLTTRAAVERLQKRVDLKAIYARDDVDYLSRAAADKPIERFISYWRGMVSTSIHMPAGSVELRVKAFRPEDAQRVAQATLEVCEQVINELNERMLHDALGTAEEEMNRATQRLTQATVAMRTARDDQQMLDATKAGDAVNKLIAESKSALLQLQQQYVSSAKFVSEAAPQNQALKSRIDATQEQIRDLEAKLTSNQASDAEPTVAESMTKFARVELENRVAERLYTGAAAALEAARLVSERKTMYLNTFVSPALPERPEYPRRALDMALVAGGSLAVWGLCCGLVLAVRNNMA